MAYENNAVVNQAPKELDYKAKETVIKDGERSQKAITNQAEKGNITNTILVDETKEIAESIAKKEVNKIPEPDLSAYYTKAQIDTLFPKKNEVSSMTLLGSAQLLNDDSDYLSVQFNNVDITKLTQKTILVFTYANCFVLGMLSQTGEGRVPGYLVYDSDGSARSCGVKFVLDNDYGNYIIKVISSIDRSLADFSSIPTAYLFAFSVI